MGRATGIPVLAAADLKGWSRGMGRKNKEKELEGVNLLGLAPTRLAEWEDDQGKVVVLRPFPTTSGVRGLLDRFFHRMSASRIRLDEVGSVAWRAMDGTRTVAEVAERLRGEFGEKVDPAERRLAHLIWQMRREGLVAYPGWDEDPSHRRGRPGASPRASR